MFDYTVIYLIADSPAFLIMIILCVCASASQGSH